MVWFSILQYWINWTLISNSNNEDSDIKLSVRYQTFCKIFDWLNRYDNPLCRETSVGMDGGDRQHAAWFWYLGVDDGDVQLNLLRRIHHASAVEHVRK